MHDSTPDSQTRLRVLLVDADERVRESLSGLLSIGDRVTVVGSAGDPAEALALIPAAQPDLVIVDPRLPEAALGAAFIDAVRAQAPGVRVLVLNWSEVVEACVGDCHPDAIVRKTFRPSELLAAIQAACAPASPAH